jgi:hypothetical protein
MPIPYGAHQVPGQPNRIRLADGSIVGRGKALNMGAKEQGYRGHKEYRAKRNPAADAAHYDAWKRGRQGREAIAKEKERAAQAGEKYNDAAMRQRFLAARNARPTKRRPAGQPFLDFVQDYGLDAESWMDY